MGCDPIDSELDDADYVSGLSTLLVATIQEAKDRISQIEYVFCSQLYPYFQSKSKSFQKFEDEWKDKENDLFRQIETIRAEKQQTLEENRLLKLDKENPSKIQEEKMNQLLAELKSVQLKGNELEQMLKQKSMEVDEGMELQSKLLVVIQSKDSVIVDKEKQLKENEEGRNVLLAKLSDLEKRVDELQEELGEKIDLVTKGNELKENLFQKIEYQDAEIMNKEEFLKDQEEEKKLILAKFKLLEENVGQLHKDLLTKNDEVEGCVKEKKLLLVKVTGLEEKVNELQEDLRQRSDQRKGFGEKLHKQIESMNSNLLAERKKYTDLTVAYKRLKSQHNYLRTKHGLTRENMLPQNKLEGASDSLRNDHNPSTSHGFVDKNQHASAAAGYAKKVKNEISCNNNLEDEKGGKLIQETSPHSPTSIFPVAPKCPPTAKSAPVAGRKRPAACWIDTRSRQGQGGPDPHDDFLDTPLENIRGKFLDLVPNDMNLDSSDDETQDVNAVIRPQKQQIPVPVAGKNGFKFVEPVRKKAERENLKGVECKQCKKFYDAVLPNDGGGKDTDKNKHNFRCEHHEGVSRHRYRYAPPLTPEGFWNIGFESEM
ncbi:protein gamma response 1 [Prunus yedoensis var. nudiflora]|uniref:Protein gamma response 1 n=1 Tax=Prunus yedoensis var. nudiflora TaxID=2094558 RepID=A0A314UV12_PRUYE|nr:protein gamma response 1 [Prunus yedoensis var. nudiflora]